MKKLTDVPKRRGVPGQPARPAAPCWSLAEGVLIPVARPRARPGMPRSRGRRSLNAGGDGAEASEKAVSEDRSYSGRAACPISRFAIVGTAPQLVTRSFSISRSTVPTSKAPWCMMTAVPVTRRGTARLCRPAMEKRQRQQVAPLRRIRQVAQFARHGVVQAMVLDDRCEVAVRVHGPHRPARRATGVEDDRGLILGCVMRGKSRARVLTGEPGDVVLDGEDRWRALRQRGPLGIRDHHPGLGVAQRVLGLPAGGPRVAADRDRAHRDARPERDDPLWLVGRVDAIRSPGRTPYSSRSAVDSAATARACSMKLSRSPTGTM